MKARLGEFVAYTIGDGGFNPRAREGATAQYMQNPIKRDVSIHAPVKARRRIIRIFIEYKVSIHAPVKARRHNKIRREMGWGFNPRAREGATTAITTKINNLSCFNPRAREGATV